MIKHFRFIERDYLYNKEKQNKYFMSDEEINQLLNDIKASYEDYTFEVIPSVAGSYVQVFDNNSETYVELDSIGPFAYNYYIREIKPMLRSDEEVSRKCIEEIYKILQGANKNKRVANWKGFTYSTKRIAQ